MFSIIINKFFLCIKQLPRGILLEQTFGKVAALKKGLRSLNTTL